MMGGSVMYGGPPDDPYGQRGGGIWPRPGPVQLPVVQQMVAPALVPESLEQTMVRMQTRVAWLEKELSMHEAWKAELVTLKNLIAAWTAPPNGKAEEPK